MRQKVLKSLAAKRKSDDGGQKLKVGELRRNTASAIEYLTEKLEKERELKKEELVVRKREIEVTVDDAIRQQQKQQQNLLKELAQ